MKHWKQVMAAGLAAVLLVTAATAAAPGLSQRLLDYLGVAAGDAKKVDLIAPGAMAVDVTKENNGAQLHVTQVLRDRYTVMLIADFTAPEDTQLYLGAPNTAERRVSKGFGSGPSASPTLLDETGESMGDGLLDGFGWDVLEDDDPYDNRISLVGTLSSTEKGEALSWDAAFLRVSALDLKYYDSKRHEYVTVYSGDWSFEVPLPQKDIGWILTTDQVLEEVTGEVYSLRGGEMYLSPLTLRFDYRFNYRRDGVGGGHTPMEIILTAADGETVNMKFESGAGDVSWRTGGGSWMTMIYRPTQVIDPAKFQGGTMTLNWTSNSKGAVTMPIYALAPVEP